MSNASVMVTPMEQLIISVADIAQQGLGISCATTGEQLGLSEADEKLATPLSISLEVSKYENGFSVAGSVEGTAVRQCVRCLTEFEDPLFVTVYADFVSQNDCANKPAAAAGKADRDKRSSESGPVREEGDEDDEMYYYEGDQVHLAPMLREQIILAAPIQPLCTQLCAGLCPRCGQNLNDRRCDCVLEPMNNPFRVLRERQGEGWKK